MIKPLVIAHRGGRVWAPENTLEAFRKSLALGVDGIELDVQRCASGEIVVIHDQDVSRTTNGVGLVQDITLSELKRLDAGSWFGPDFKGERIPTLNEVLDLIEGKVVLNIEVKNTPIEYPGIEEDLISLLEDYPNPHTLIVSSFDHSLIEKFNGVSREYDLAVLCDALLVGIGDYAHRLKAKYWHPCFDSVRDDAVNEAHRAGLKVNAWTVNAQRDWLHAIKMNIDGIVTDDPEGLKAFLNQMSLVSDSVS